MALSARIRSMAALLELTIEDLDSIDRQGARGKVRWAATHIPRAHRSILWGSTYNRCLSTSIIITFDSFVFQASVVFSDHTFAYSLHPLPSCHQPCKEIFIREQAGFPSSLLKRRCIYRVGLSAGFFFFFLGLSEDFTSQKLNLRQKVERKSALDTLCRITLFYSLSIVYFLQISVGIGHSTRLFLIGCIFRIHIHVFGSVSIWFVWMYDFMIWNSRVWYRSSHSWEHNISLLLIRISSVHGLARTYM